MIDSLTDARARFLAFLTRELAPSNRRVIEAARNATKATITSGLAAIMQIMGPFGPLFAFRIGQPGIALGLREGVITIAIAAMMQAAIVPLTGKLLDYPGLIMAFLFLVFATVTYLSSNTRLFMLLALTAVGTITTVYVGIFRPGSIGWGSTYTFDGILVATLVLVVVDTLIWPSPPEPRLLESIAASLSHTRKRFAMVNKRYLDPSRAPLPAPHIESTLAANLALLKAVEENLKSPGQRLTVLLDAVVTAERLRLEVERLAILADAPASSELRGRHREAIALACEALDEALAQRIEDVRAGLLTVISAGRVTALTETIQHLHNLNAQLLPAVDRSIDPDLVSVPGFVSGLEAIAVMLEPQDRASSAAITQTVEDEVAPHPIIDPVAFRLSVKIGAAMTLALLVGLTSQRADLQTILWSVAVAGLPNTYGAVARKTILRLAGCIVGGLAALAAMIVVSQKFDSLPAYLAAIFVVTMLATYIAQSDEWLSYAGIQAGITFLICYVGLAPSDNVYAPLWRFWGIVLGVLTTGFVFLFVWPEYATDLAIASLEKLLRSTLAFGREVADRTITAPRLIATERRLSANVFATLNLSDQARLEGRRGVIVSAAAIEAASTLIRIAYRFEMIGRGRIGESTILLPAKVSEREAIFEEGCCAALEVELARLARRDSSEYPVQSPGAPSIDSTALPDDLNMLEIAHLPLEIRIALTTKLESYRRLPSLLSDLNDSLLRILSS